MTSCHWRRDRAKSAREPWSDTGILSPASQTTYDLLSRHEADKPNDIWQADHTLFDLWLRHDDGPPVRPWLTVIMDDYSRAIAGFGLSVQAPSAIQTALIRRQAIWRKPLPQ